MGEYVQYLEEWNLLKEDTSKKVQRSVPATDVEPPKKKRRTTKADVTSMERIDSYMSNTYLGKMRAAGELKSAPVSKNFFERAKKKKKKKKGAKTEPKGLKQLKFLIGGKKN